MIRIETTAEFDADGRFIVTGQTTAAVTPGPHRVTMILVEAPRSETVTPADAKIDEDSRLEWIDGVLVFTGELLEDPEDCRRRLDEERTNQIISGQFE